jgi:biotin synthase
MDLGTMSRRVARGAASKARSVRFYSIVHDVPRTGSSFGQTASPPQAPRAQSIFEQAVNATGARNTWTKEEISQIHQTPLMELAYAAVSQLDQETGMP